MKQGSNAADRAGWSLAEWCPVAGISRAMHYTLDEDLRPRYVKIGDRRIITENPAAWLERVAAAGGVPVKSRAFPQSADGGSK